MILKTTFNWILWTLSATSLFGTEFDGGSCSQVFIDKVLDQPSRRYKVVAYSAGRELDPGLKQTDVVTYPKGYKNNLSYPAARIYDLTGDTAMFERINWQLDSLAKTWEAYEALPESERNLDATIAKITGPIGKAGQPQGYFFKNLIIPSGKSKYPGSILSFGYDRNGVVFLAVPADMWAKCGASYDYPQIKIGE